MKCRLFLLLLFFTASCLKEPYTVSTKQQLINEVRREVAIQLKKEKDLYPCGTGAEAMNQIKMLALIFNYYKPADMDKGRELVIDAVDRFITAVNANEEIRPYLGNYPFEPKNIQIEIFLRNLDGSDIPPGELAVIVTRNGTLKYETFTPGGNSLKTIYSETYEEAHQKLKNLSDAIAVTPL